MRKPASRIDERSRTGSRGAHPAARRGFDRRDRRRLRHRGDRAFYSPNYDFIQVPRPETYFEPINWHRTALHELGHWTGAAQRLDRDLSGSFGSKYAQEELVAEITSAFVCASLGIVPTVRHADYIGSWLEVVRDDDRAIVRAASAAPSAVICPSGCR